MDLKTVFTKTAKGVTQVNQKTQSLSRDLMKVLKAIDGKSDVSALADKSGFDTDSLEKSLNQLKKDGFVKIFEIKKEEPLSEFGGDDDFDFTAPNKMGAPMVTFGPSKYRTPASDGLVERAPAPAAPVEPPPPDNRAELEAALTAARAKAKAEAQARTERETQIRARLEVEARARKEAELRAMEEARRTQRAAEQARADLEARLAEEKKQRTALSDTRSRMTREQLNKEEEQQRALAAARAKAEAEAEALAQARVKAEAEAKALAVARMQAEAAAKKQQEELDAAQRDLRQQLKAEIEAKVRAEMKELLEADVEEGARAEVEAAVMQEAHEEARRMLEEQLHSERASMERAAAEAKRQAEEDARRMLAEQETRIRAEMEARVQEISEQKARAEIEARKMAEAQAEASAKAAADLAARLKTEEDARRAAEAEAETRSQHEAANRARLEARAREEAEEHARLEAEMKAKLVAEKEAKIQAQARLLIESEMREKSERENLAKIDVERRGREEAEKKAHMESKAREVASRAVAEQVAKREELERLAEERIAHERAMRERAEEKAMAEERAEAEMRAAQVARLKELSEQAEQKRLEQADDSGRPRRRGPKKQSHPIRWLIVSVFSLVVLGIAALHLVPLGAVNTRLEKSLAGWLHDDVSSTGLRVSLFPRPHVKLDQIALGKILDAKAASGRLYMDMGALYGDRFAIGTMELNDVTIAADAVPRALIWAKSEDRGKSIEIENIVLKNVKLELKGIVIDPFDAEFKVDRQGKIVRAAARSRDGKWTLSVIPARQAAADVAAADAPAPTGPIWAVEFTARNMNLPIGTPLPISDFRAQGTWSGEEMNFTQVEGKFFEGSGAGTLKVDWKQGLNFSSDFSVQKIRVEDLVSSFTRDVAVTGKMEGTFSASGSGTSIGNLADKLVVQGTYLVKDGSVGNTDLVQAMRSPGSVGGQTKFSELVGQLRISDGIIRYEKLKLAGGVLLAGGNVNVTYGNGALSGNVSAELKSSVAQDRALFSLAGNVARPGLRRGG